MQTPDHAFRIPSLLSLCLPSFPPPVASEYRDGYSTCTVPIPYSHSQLYSYPSKGNYPISPPPVPNSITSAILGYVLINRLSLLFTSVHHPSPSRPPLPLGKLNLRLLLMCSLVPLAQFVIRNSSPSQSIPSHTETGKHTHTFRVTSCLFFYWQPLQI